MTAVGAFYEDENLTFIQKDTEQAFKWFTKAAKHGEVDAMVRLGMMHDMGVPPAELDAVKANKLFAVLTHLNPFWMSLLASQDSTPH